MAFMVALFLDSFFCIMAMYVMHTQWSMKQNRSFMFASLMLVFYWVTTILSLIVKNS